MSDTVKLTEGERTETTMTTKRIYVDRSRVETAQACRRRRWWEYHAGPEGRGIVPRRKSLPLAVGGAVHEGLASLLRDAMALPEVAPTPAMEDAAVIAALDDFAQYRNAIAAEREDATDAGLVEANAAEAAPFGTPMMLDASTVSTATPTSATSAYDDFLFAEQSALVEGLVRAWARRRLRPLLEQYEVLEVEREGEWRLGDVAFAWDVEELWFMSRPDALLLDRTSGQLVLQSFKTASVLDTRRLKDAEHDMQGLSEAPEVERRLAEWWEIAQQLKEDELTDSELAAEVGGTSSDARTMAFLRVLASPPRILAIRYDYLLKGSRDKDDRLTDRFGFAPYVQKSHLVRAYLNAGMAAGDEQWNWSFGYRKDDGTTSRLYAKNWPPAQVWERMSVKAWIDMLDASEVQGPTAEERSSDAFILGCDIAARWTGPAQSTGSTDVHPLDAALPPPVIVYRQEDESLDWAEETEAQERAVAGGVAAVRAAEEAGDDGARRSALNRWFPKTRRACVWPVPCNYQNLCYGSDDIRKDPIGSGLYKIREANHPQEFYVIDSGDKVV